MFFYFLYSPTITNNRFKNKIELKYISMNNEIIKLTKEIVYFFIVAVTLSSSCISK